MGISNSRPIILRHVITFDSGAVISNANAILRFVIAVVSALCIGRRIHRKGNFALDNSCFWFESDALCPIICERLLEHQPNGLAAAKRRHTNCLPLAVIVVGTNQRNAAIAKHESLTNANILFGNSAKYVRGSHLRGNQYRIRQFQRHVRRAV